MKEYAQGVDIGRAYPSIFAIFAGPRPAPWSEAQKREEFEKALSRARSSDLVVLVLGEHEEMSGEAASHSTIDLRPSARIARSRHWASQQCWC